MRSEISRWILCLCFWCTTSAAFAQQKVIIDTDIGDDVDDAFALALAVKSPELQVLGFDCLCRNGRKSQDRGPISG